MKDELDLFGVKIVPAPVKNTLAISGAQMTHAENLTTGEQKKILTFIDAIKLSRGNTE